MKNLVVFFYIDDATPWKYQKALMVVEDAKKFFGEECTSEY